MKKLLLLTLATAPFICSAKDLWLSLNAGASANIVSGQMFQRNDFGINPTFDIRARRSFAKLLQAGVGVNVMPLVVTQKDAVVVTEDSPTPLAGSDVKTFYASPMVSPYLTFGIAPKYKKSTLAIGAKIGASFGIASDKEYDLSIVPADGTKKMYVDFKTSGANAGVYIDYVYNIRNVGVGVSFMPTYYNIWGKGTWGYTAFALPVSISANIKL